MFKKYKYVTSHWPEEENNLLSMFLVNRTGRFGFKLQEEAFGMGTRKKIINNEFGEEVE